MDPGGAIVEFVEELVEGFLEEVGVEQKLRRNGLRDEAGVCLLDRELVGAEKLGSDGVLPESGPGFQVFGIVGAALGEGIERGVGGIAKGAEQACYVFKWGLLGSALRQAAGGFALEVEDDVVAVGAKYLA